MFDSANWLCSAASLGLRTCVPCDHEYNDLEENYEVDENRRDARSVTQLHLPRTQRIELVREIPVSEPENRTLRDISSLNDYSN